MSAAREVRSGRPGPVARLESVQVHPLATNLGGIFELRHV